MLDPSKSAPKASDYRKHYGDRCEAPSVDFSAAREEIWNGQLPYRFRRLVPVIPGATVVEIGAGEGILSLALAETKKQVRAIEYTPTRHRGGLELQARWRSLGRDVDRCEMVLGDILERLDLLDGFETMVACRVIYYFQDRVDGFLQAVRDRVPRIVLSGNGKRAQRYNNGEPSKDLGAYAIYATMEGMADAATRNGFKVIESNPYGDPYVIAERR